MEIKISCGFLSFIQYADRNVSTYSNIVSKVYLR